jgi:phosphatidate cytidylyltransferase
MLGTRVLAALIFTPALTAVLWRGGWALQATCLLLSLMLLHEFMSLVLRPASSVLRALTYVLGLLTAAAAVQPTWAAYHEPLALVCLLSLLTAAVLQPEPIERSLQHAALALLGIGWCCGLLPYLSRLRDLPADGLGLAAMALLCTWAGDSGAYFAGHSFGRHRLHPRVSPAKTLEGSFGGLICAMLAGATIRAVFSLEMGLLWALCLGAACALAGTAGDLCESLLKRSVGAKDSSRLIPGHGGLFDRFDGVVFSIGVVYCLSHWIP